MLLTVMQATHRHHCPKVSAIPAAALPPWALQPTWNMETLHLQAGSPAPPWGGSRDTRAHRVPLSYCCNLPNFQDRGLRFQAEQ